MTAEDTNDPEKNNASNEHSDGAITPDHGARKPATKPKLPSRNTIARQERRLRSDAKKTRKRRLYTAGGSLIALALIAGLVLPSIGGGSGSSSPGNQDVVVKEREGTEVEIQVGEVIADTSSTIYATTPPTSGPRLEQPSDWGVHVEQIPDGQAVRNLEYGAVIFNHGLAGEDLDKLSEFAKAQQGYPGCFIVHPHPAIKPGQVIMTSWGWLHEVRAENQESMQKFVDDHRNKGPLFVDNACGTGGSLGQSSAGQGHSS